MHPVAKAPKRPTACFSPNSPQIPSASWMNFSSATREAKLAFRQEYNNNYNSSKLKNQSRFLTLQACKVKQTSTHFDFLPCTGPRIPSNRPFSFFQRFLAFGWCVTGVICLTITTRPAPGRSIAPKAQCRWL